MRRPYRDVTLAVEDRHWWYRGRRRILHAILAKLPLPRPARSLDAGCGGGGNMVELAAHGSVTGLEPEAAALQIARSRALGDVVEGWIEEMPFEDAKFDLAVAMDVIEHLDDARLALAELRRVVKPGGFLVVTVPAFPFLWGPHDIVNEHRRRYIRSSLLTAAAGTGWSPLATSYFSSALLPVAAVYRPLQRLRMGRHVPRTSDFERTPTWLDRPLEMPFRLEARVIGSGRRMVAGTSLIGVFTAG